MEKTDGLLQLREAVAGWFSATVASGSVPPPLDRTSVATIASNPDWERVRVALSAVAPFERRPDLYGSLRKDAPPPVLSDWQVLAGSGLAWALREACATGQIDPSEIAREFADFVAGPVAVSEDWLLLDAVLPPGCEVRVGEYTLQAASQSLLEAVRPAGGLGGHREFALGSPLLDGAAFLHRVVPDRALRTGMPIPMLHTRPELTFWIPLLALSLWRSEPLHMDAVYTVERGRQVLRTFGELHEEVQHLDGDDMWITRTHGAFEVDEADLPRFAVFCDRIGSLIATLAAEEKKSGKKNQGPGTSARALRLSRAGEHLVRASHRTFGTDFVWDEEADEAVLHYVIALEAPLSDSPKGDKSDLGRKVQQRAAMLWLNDERVRVADIIKGAYRLRSAYAHGSPTTRLSAPELNALRHVAHQVLLRWLVLAPEDDTLWEQLDECLLSTSKYQEFVREPLLAFFTEVAPAHLPPDLHAENELPE